MAKNGSPEPRFETGDNYNYFITILPIHPAFLVDDEISGSVNDGGDGGAKQAENKLNKILKIIYGGVNDGVNGGVNEIVGILLNVSGLNTLEIATRINKSPRTTERYLRILRKKGIVEFRGVPKTGGYHLTETAKDKLK
jgi:ATP-dependent DNA helicase RecG